MITKCCFKETGPGYFVALRLNSSNPGKPNSPIEVYMAEIRYVYYVY